MKKYIALIALVLATGNAWAMIEDLRGYQLNEASQRGDLQTIKEILNNDEALLFYGTPLYWAAGAGSLEMVTTLINEGADVNAKNPEGLTALHEAVRSGNFAVVEYLCNHGARIKADNFRQTPIQIARTMHRQDIVEVLENAVRN